MAAAATSASMDIPILTSRASTSKIPYHVGHPQSPSIATSSRSPSIFAAQLPKSEPVEHSLIDVLHAGLPQRPDRTAHDRIKAKYRVLQKKYEDLMADRNKLQQDCYAAEDKLERLQSEADMLIEQMHPLAPHISLAVDYVDLNSDASDAEAGPSRIKTFNPQVESQHGRGRVTSASVKGKEARHTPLLSAEDAAQEEAIVEEARLREERGKSYNPEGVKVRIGIIPDGFMFGNDTANASRTETPLDDSTEERKPRKRRRTSSVEQQTAKGATASALNRRKSSPLIKEEEEDVGQ